MLAFIMLVGAIIVGFYHLILLSLKEKKDVKTTDVLYKIGIPLSILVAIGFTIYIGFRISASERELLPISVIALFIGAVIESFRICKDLKIITKNFLIFFTWEERKSV